MAISALPASTRASLGAGQALTDVSSLVKELIENAIDAGASSITVEVSSNLLDKIQVTDNGTGIHAEDRPLVCQRYCTSKIRELYDLDEIASRSLGFRGEALASAAELSEAVLLTTRTAAEDTAAECRYGRSGLLSK